MQPDVFSKSDLFDDAFDPNDMTATNLDLVESVHKILQLLVLRRKKSQVDLALPPKKEFRLLCPLSKQQTFWYKRILLMNAHMLLTGASEDNASGGNDLPIKVEDKTVEASGVAVSNGGDLSSSSAAAHPSTTTKKR